MIHIVLTSIHFGGLVWKHSAILDFPLTWHQSVDLLIDKNHTIWASQHSARILRILSDDWYIKRYLQHGFSIKIIKRIHIKSNQYCDATKAPTVQLSVKPTMQLKLNTEQDKCRQTSDKWPLCKSLLLKRRRETDRKKKKRFYMLFKVCTLSGSPWLALRRALGVPSGHQERGKERVELHAEWIGLHPKLPWTREQCVITILGAEECVKRSKVAQSLAGPDMHRRAKVKALARLEPDWILSSSCSIYAQDVKRPLKYQ